LEEFMKRKNSIFIYEVNNLKVFNTIYKYQRENDYWEKRKNECEKNLSKFC